MDLNGLNKEQKEAVLYNDGPLLIIAGAGSGKTRAITYKVAYLVESGVNPQNILAITFTNKAASEMKERVEGLLGNSSKQVFISTFHKFCGRVLRVFIETIGYNRNFSIYDTDDQKKILTNIIKDLGYDDKKVKAKSTANRISYCKNHDISLDEFKKSAKSDTEKIYARCFEEYEKRMFKNNAIDFDDMLLLTVKVLKSNENVRKTLSSKFKYILVDEYQDTNLVQFEIIKLLTMDNNNFLTVVGDDDQSIYRFRGADIRNILEFENVFNNAKVIKLTQNYRSTNNILSVANSVIKNNIGRKDKNLWSENGEGAKVIFTEYEDDAKESYAIINDIKKNGNYKNTAILYRTNAQSRKFEEMCVSLSIPYTLIGGVNFYERREIKDVLAYMHILVNPSDTNSLFRIINVPKRGIGDTTIAKILDYAGKNNITPFEAVFNFEHIELGAKIKEKLKDFVNLIVELKNENEIDGIIDRLLKNCYEEFLISEYGEEDGKERLENINELKNKAITFKTTYPQNADNDILKDFATNMSAQVILEDFLYEIALVSDIDDLNENDDKLTLMSLHASKGLEFDNIYLTGLNEGIFPSYQAITADDSNAEIEEERRLCYVGITRAKKNLYLTSARRRMHNGNYNSYLVSRFVDEIDNDAIVKNILTTKSGFDDFNSDFNEWGYHRRGSFTKAKFNNYIESRSKNKHIDNIGVSKIDLKKSIDTYKTGANIIKEAELKYKVGDRVTHVKFGDGLVTNIDDVGRDYEVTVDFDEVGSKTLFATFAKLEKI
ncbi:MAG: UvrD-helicase domain-containing protein [Lachnospiraceae bacterium]|nr:UvrD-helicase domain-containing protein [Lachnospiraceae bacterium]